MAKIKTKDKGKFKVQFYLNEELEELYKSNRKAAKERGVFIDFSEDFSKWFQKENQAIEKQLAELGQKSGPVNP